MARAFRLRATSHFTWGDLPTNTTAWGEENQQVILEKPVNPSGSQFSVVFGLEVFIGPYFFENAVTITENHTD